MSKLLLMRHGKSVGNENNIIQGVSDFALTLSGKRDVERLVSENISKFDDYERIISSDLKRAVQTADILKEKVNKKVEYDPLVREVSAGILDRVRKKDASEKYPYYYDIWNSRGDLDNIPLAETGDELQSRVLMFLEQYMDNDKNDIIVSHAAFLRSLYNTLMFQKRTNKLNLSHDNIYEIKNPWANLNVKKHDIAKNSVVHEISTYEKKYIMKKTKKEQIEILKREKDLLDFLNKYIITPKIISYSSRNDYNLKILEYSEGRNINDNSLSKEAIQNTLIEVNKLENALKKYPNAEDFELLSINNDFLSTLDEINNLEIKKIGLDAYSNEHFINGIKNDSVQLVHDDLHRDNILYKKNKPILLDFEGLKNTASSYQLASHLAVNYILYDDNISLDYLVNLYPESSDLDYIRSLVIYRLLKGYAFFENRYDKFHQNDDYSFVEKYKKTLKRMGENN